MDDLEYRDDVGMRTAVRQRGDGEPVIFVHGNPGSADEWQPFLDRAGELGRVIAPDMPGFARSARPELVDFVLVAGAGHWCFRDDPKMVDRVIEFLG